ncbi:hypothetical protein HID58_093996 [Brassica napus]|uniref:Uncharacterized protein n=1 Tax=Brassica napus TaxID=3708 RepID=A0ABQ7X937_BRANA|nr:hypothetical protein HID58_093996 [Brassica napus]
MGARFGVEYAAGSWWDHPRRVGLGSGGVKRVTKVVVTRGPIFLGTKWRKTEGGGAEHGEG